MARFSADLHIHSRNFQGPLARMEFSDLASHAAPKGINLIGTGDCLWSHRARKIQQELVPAGNGFFQVPQHPNIYFILTTELAVPIDRRRRCRRIHLLLLLPGLAAIENLQRTLPEPFSTREGVPVYNLPIDQFIQRVQDSQPEAILIPAHIFNPDNSLFSGPEMQGRQCHPFDEWGRFFPALETGLSADPANCWRLKMLDDKVLVSFSDARSPEELGREVTFFSAEFSYPGLRRALTGKKEDRVLGTLEYCSELGSHFFNGHQQCGIVRSPVETRLEGTSCPACHASLTIGTLQRTQELADRSYSELNLYQHGGWIHSRRFERSPYRKTIPLREVIAASGLISGRDSRKVSLIYDHLVRSGLTELKILLEAPPEELMAFAPVPLVEALQRTRENRFRIAPGYDGAPGHLTIMEKEERITKVQLSLFH